MRIKKSIALAVSALMMTAGFTGCSGKSDKESAAAVKYNWSNVAIGGGGYVTGMEYSKAEEGLVYARTDIGGAYRRSKSQDSWVAITDHLGSDEWNLIGIESIAADPVDAKRVYIACGTYMDTSNGAILSSDDYGETWTRFDLPFGCGGNQSGRGTGERLAVDPKDNKNVYFGSRTQGLWKSTDYGKTWAQVTSFPTTGSYSQEGNALGVMWVRFDPNSEDVYAGVAESNDGKCIYRSSDKGETWTVFALPEKGLYPLQADISPNGKMYISCSDNCGPNLSPENGKVYAFDMAAGSFTDITPQVGDGRYGGFSGVSVDAQNPDTVVVSTVGFWSEYGDNIYRTTDGGATWSAFYDKNKNYTMDTSEADWLKWGNEEAKLGWWTSDININPFNSDEAMYGTGATIYSTVNLTALGTGTPVTVKFDAYGLEETAVYKMVSPPEGGPQLYSIMGDLTGFSHVDVTKCPDDQHFMKDGDPSDIDCAWLNPDIAVRSGDSAGALRYTTDGGVTWNRCTALPESAADGTVAVSADGSSFIWTPATSTGKSYVTYDMGETWFFVNGIGYGAAIAADRVNPNKFYAVYNDMFFYSEDGGQNFTSTNMVMQNAKIAAVGDREGDVWVYNNGLIMHTEDGGQNFKTIKNFKCEAMGFGAPEKDGDYMVIYAMGDNEKDGDGIYRSTDKGETWERINDEHHLFGNLTHSITGDSTIYGRVYFATNGRGIVMGDIAE
ncbi:MAG: WD40/YVTN/BNR-like repeat-containing protein [Porcipelethomonas sp.]